MFSFKPLTDDEITALKNEGLLTEGTYSFTVKSIEIKKSEAGNEMLKILLDVKAAANDIRVLTDYLVITEKMMFKLKHFCEAIGLQDAYDAGKFMINACVGRAGRCIIGVQKGKPKPDGSGYYSDKNSVRDYVKQETLSTAKADFDDEIKF